MTQPSFLQVFGEQMRIPVDVLACAAAELLQPYDPAEPRACSRDSPVALIHMRLLDLVSRSTSVRPVSAAFCWQFRDRLSILLRSCCMPVQPTHGNLLDTVSTYEHHQPSHHGIREG